MDNRNIRSEKKQNKIDNRGRLREITDVLRRNHITRGITPEKLRVICEELGPTYIKLGQIMSLHSDILPQRYCDELMKLSSEVTPMPFSEVEEVVNGSFREDWHNIFSSFDETPLGSASIAQVHRAVLLDGDQVVVKVQRKGIYDTMARDIALLHRAVRLMPPIGGLKNVVDLDMVLDEMWVVAQEEMDFLKEASNIEEFARNNRGIAYIRVPRLYRDYTTQRVLVMEYVGGYAINDADGLKEAGYDLTEVGSKLVNNYVKQVMDDGFFHADPHPGNVKVVDGKIVWIDMGMMGRLTEHDRKCMIRGVRGIAVNDVAAVEDAILDLCDSDGKPDTGVLYHDLRELLSHYTKSSMGNINVPQFFQEVLDVMKENHLILPHGMTMLARGLTHMEGVLTEISPDLNMTEIAAGRVREDYFSQFDLKKEVKKINKQLYRSMYKTVEIPPLVKSALEEYLRGQARVNLELNSTRSLAMLLRKLVRNLVIGMVVTGLLIGSSIICTTNMEPKVMGIPAIGAFGFLGAIGISVFLVVRHFVTRERPGKPKKRIE
ncbi:MAG: ABC1 kinase family protein [Bilifractor sp.]